jgi:aminoglycoside phosphotransferase (APT) family kinase protein
MQALRGSPVPVPQVYGYCESDAIVGAPFYLMEFRQGRVLVDQSLPGIQPAERAAIYDEMNRVIAELHRVAPSDVGLDSFGCMSWHIPASLWRGIGGLDLAALGIPDERSFRERYAQRTGASGFEHWDFYLAYNLFRMAAILQGDRAPGAGWHGSRRGRDRDRAQGQAARRTGVAGGTTPRKQHRLTGTST